MNEVKVISPAAAENLTDLLLRLEQGERVQGVIEPLKNGHRIKIVSDALSEVDESLKQLLSAGSESTQSSDPMIPEHYQQAVSRFDPYKEVLGMSLKVLQILTDGKVIVDKVSVDIGKPLRRRNNKMPHEGKFDSLQDTIKSASQNYARRYGLWVKNNETLYAEQTEELKKGVNAAISAEFIALQLLEGYQALHIGLESFEDGWMVQAARAFSPEPEDIDIEPDVLVAEPDISNIFNIINEKETEARTKMKLATDIASSSKIVIDKSQGENYILTQKQVTEDEIVSETGFVYGKGLRGALNTLTIRTSRFTDILSNQMPLVLGGFTPSSEKDAKLLEAVKTMVEVEKAEIGAKDYTGRLERLRTDLSSGFFLGLLPTQEAGVDIDLDSLKPYPAAFEHYSTRVAAVINAPEFIRAEFETATAGLRQQALNYLENPPSTVSEINSTIRDVNSLLRSVDAADAFIKAGLTDKSPEEIFPLETHEELTEFMQSLETAKADIPPLEAYLRDRNLVSTNLARARSRLGSGKFEAHDIDIYDPGHEILLAKLSSHTALHESYSARISDANTKVETGVQQLQSTYQKACADMREQAEMFLNTIIESGQVLARVRTRITALQLEALSVGQYTIPGLILPGNPIDMETNKKLTQYKELLAKVDSKALDPAKTISGSILLEELDRYSKEAIEELRRGGRHTLEYMSAFHHVRSTQRQIESYPVQRPGFISSDPRVAPYIQSLTTRTLADSISPELTKKIGQLLPSEYRPPSSYRSYNR